MTVNKAPTAEILYYRDNITAWNLSNYVIKMEGDGFGYNQIGYVYITLDNTDNLFSSDGTGAENEQKIKLEHDIKVTVDSGVKIYGPVISKQPDTKTGTILLTVAEPTIYLTRNTVPCMNRIKLYQSVYNLLTDATDGVPDATNILYNVQDWGKMDSGTHVKLTLTGSVSGPIYNYSRTWEEQPFLKFGRTDSAFDILKNLAELTDCYFYIEKSLDGSNNTILTLYFIPLSTSVSEAIATYGVNIIENIIEKTEQNKCDRVVCYGNTERRIMAIAAGSAEEASAAHSIELRGDYISDTTSAQRLADIEYSYRATNFYTGTCDIIPLTGVNPIIDNKLLITDSTHYFSTQTTLRISSYSFKWGVDGYYYTIGIDRKRLELSTYLETRDKQITDWYDYYKDPINEIEPCAFLISPTAGDSTMADTIYGDLAPEPAWTSPAAGQIKAEWNTTDEQRTGGDTWLSYVMYGSTVNNPPLITDLLLTENADETPNEGGGKCYVLKTGLAAGTYHCQLQTSFGLAWDSSPVNSSVQDVVVA